MAETEQVPELERSEVRKVLLEHGLDEVQAENVTAALSANPQRWVNFMMRFELGLEEPAASRALGSALTIGGSYAVGGLIPLFPYFLLSTVARALPISIALTLIALFIFGGVKGRLTGVAPVLGAFQTAAAGGLAAAAAFGIARLVGGL